MPSRRNSRGLRRYRLRNARLNAEADAKPQATRDLDDAPPGLLQQPARSVEPEIEIIGVWSDTQMAGEEYLQGSHARSDLRRDPRDRERLLDRSLHEPDRRGKPRLEEAEPADLDDRLAVGRQVLLVIDEDARDIEGDCHAMLEADQVQHHIERRCGTSRRETLAIDDEAIRDHIDRRESRRELIDLFPVRRRSVAVEQASFRQNPAAGFDCRREALWRGRSLASARPVPRRA